VQEEEEEEEERSKEGGNQKSISLFANNDVLYQRETESEI
jgi:hypothetical protein